MTPAITMSTPALPCLHGAVGEDGQHGQHGAQQHPRHARRLLVSEHQAVTMPGVRLLYRDMGHCSLSQLRYFVNSFYGWLF